MILRIDEELTEILKVGDKGQFIKKEILKTTLYMQLKDFVCSKLLSANDKYSMMWWSDSVKSTFVSAQPKNHSKPLQICLGCPKKILSSIGVCEQSSLWVLCFDEFTF